MPVRNTVEDLVDNSSHQHRNGDERGYRKNSSEPAAQERLRIMIEGSIQRVDQRAKCGNGMRQPSPDQIGIADKRIERKRREDDPDRIAEENHVSGSRARVRLLAGRSPPPASVRRTLSIAPASQAFAPADRVPPTRDAEGRRGPGPRRMSLHRPPG